MDTPSLDDQIRREQRPWSLQENIAYYRTHRRRPDDLYETERFFLPQILPQVLSVLDVGCAAGGFSQIMHYFNPTIRYVGVDVTPELIAFASQEHPSDEFHLSDGVHFPFPAGSFDLVYCSGVLHLNSKYREMVQSMWEQTQRYLLCDFRIAWDAAEMGEMSVAAGDKKSKQNVLPYHILNVGTLMTFLQNLAPRPAVIRAKGYSHAISPAARVTIQNVIMAFFLLEKGTGENTTLQELSFNVL